MKYGNELKVGLVVLAAVVVFIFGFRFFRDLPLFRGSYELHTRLENAGGLVPGNPVRISGVKVGSVEKVGLSEDPADVAVRFRVNDGVRVPEGSTAKVSGLGAIGGVQLAIEPGPSTNPPLEDGDYVPAGPSDNLLGDLRTRAPQLIDHADSLLVNANAAMRAANHTFEGAGRLLSDSNSDLRLTLAAIRRSTQTLDRALNAQEGRLQRVLDNAAATTGDLRAFTANNTDSLSQAVTRLNSALVRLNTNLAALDTTTARLNTITARIESGEGTLGRLVNDPGLYMRLDSTASRLSFVLEDFQKNPGRYLDELTLVEIF